MVHETRKILGDQSIHVTATTVRVPVYALTFGSHQHGDWSGSYRPTKPVPFLATMPGVLVYDDPARKSIPCRWMRREG